MKDQQDMEQAPNNPEVIVPTNAVASEAPVQPTQMRPQSGGADVQEPALASPLTRIILWLFSGFVVLLVAVLLNVFVSLVTGRNSVVNIISYIVGFVGVVLLFVGPYKAVKIFLQNK